MGRLKTTGETTEPYSFRLNPAYEQDKAAIDIVTQKRLEGFSIRQIMTDAIVRASGYTPEMFSDYGEGHNQMTGLEQMLSNFAKEIIDAIGQRPSQPVYENEDNSSEHSTWANTLAKGFIARQKQVMGDDE